MRHFLLIGCFVIGTQHTFAQMPEPDRGRPKTVTVRGTGTVAVTPDQVRMSIQVTVRGESASAAMTSASMKTKEVLEILDSFGVKAKDIQTTRVGVSPIYDYEKRPQPPPIIGYSVSNDFVVIFKDASMNRVGEFMDRAVQAGASNFGSLAYESSKQRELERDALARAADDARARAEGLARELGAEVGRVLSVSESGMTPPGPIVHDYMRAEAAVAAPVMTGEISIVSKVDVVFELKEK